MYAALTYIPGGGLLTGFAMRSDPFGRTIRQGSDTHRKNKTKSHRGTGAWGAHRDTEGGWGGFTHTTGSQGFPSLSYSYI